MPATTTLPSPQLSLNQWATSMTRTNPFAVEPALLGYAVGSTQLPGREILKTPDAVISLPVAPKLSDVVSGKQQVRLTAEQTDQIVGVLSDSKGPFQTYGRKFAPTESAEALASEPEGMAIVVAKQRDGSSLFYCGVPQDGVASIIAQFRLWTGADDMTAMTFPHPGPGLLREGAVLIMSPLTALEVPDLAAGFGNRAVEITSVMGALPNSSIVSGRFVDGGILEDFGGDPSWGLGQLVSELSGPQGLGVIWLLTRKPE